LPAHQKAVAEMQKAGKPVQWAKVSLTVLQNFARYIEEDLNYKSPPQTAKKPIPSCVAR